MKSKPQIICVQGKKTAYRETNSGPQPRPATRAGSHVHGSRSHGFRLHRTLLTAAVCTALIFSLAGCSSSTSAAGSSTDISSQTNAGRSESSGQTGSGSDSGMASQADSSGSEEGSSVASEATEAETAAPATSAEDIEISHYADIEVKDYGTITVALSEKTAPETVKNFVSLAESGFYNGLTFHRIIDGFMIQGGDPNGDGTGGSDKTIEGEFSENGIENNISHVRGAISMARSSDYNSASSQFFIVQSDSTYLDGQYAGFGFVTDGMDVVDKICADAQPADNNGTIAKDSQPVISSITIREA